VEPTLDSSGPPEIEISNTLNPLHQPKVKQELVADDNADKSLSNNGVSSPPPTDDDYSPTLSSASEDRLFLIF